MVYGSFVLLFYCLTYVSYCVLACYRLRSLQAKHASSLQLLEWGRFLVFKFRPSRFYWGILLLLHGMAISITPVLFDSTHAVVMAFAAVFFLSTFLQVGCWPYRSSSHNCADVLVCSALMTLTIAGNQIV